MPDIAAIGAGPAGLCVALALAKMGVASTIIAAPHKPAGNRPDTRTAALFNPSIALLQNIGVFDSCRADCAELKAIRLVDDTEGLFKAPAVLFEAREIGVPRFGYNVPQEPLMLALNEAARVSGLIEVIESQGVRKVIPEHDFAHLELAEGGRISAKLVIAADGRRSVARESVNIAVKETPCPQAALTCVFMHARPHHGVSTELHRKAGPLTVVPMPGNASSLVWVERPDVAERLKGLSDEAFQRVLEENLQGLLGDIHQPGPRALFPLSHLGAETMGKDRVALLGESGHAMPPIGAQGLNLSLRDVACLVELVVEAVEAGRDVGGADLLQRYSTLRLADAKNRDFAVWSMNQALLTELLPLRAARGAALHVIRAVGPLRRQLMQLGMAPPGDLPALMRPQSA
ncbi:MAG: FAD-dependent monooxygenase [Filomicrobium sp.]